MQRKIPAVRITQKNQKTLRLARIAVRRASLIEYAPLAVITVREPFMQQQNKGVQIGVDLMGHEGPPEVLLQSICKLSLPPDVQLLLIGLPEYAPFASLFSYKCASEVISMDEPPLTAVRKKKDSSLCVGLRLLKEKKIDTFISAGSTGALVSAAKMILGMQSKLLRPALLALLPTQKAPVAVLDVGANVEAKEKHLVQFAFMGAEHQKMRGVKYPKVALLNIGSEPTKGTIELRSAYKTLKTKEDLPFEFIGNIEGTSAFKGDIDVLVTSGFTGNIFLKTSEGIANFLLKELSTQIPKKILAPYLSQLMQKMHYEEYPGAILAGVRGHVIKCHGYSGPQSFIHAIETAIQNSRHYNRTSCVT